MMLDQRAERASEGIRRSVGGTSLFLMRQQPVSRRTPVTAFAAAFAGVLFLVGLVLGPSRWFATDAPVATTIPTSVVTVPAVVTTTTGPTSTTTVPADSPTTTVQAPGAAPADTTPPWIVIESPEQGAHSSEKTIRFEGTVEPGAAVTAGRYEAEVTADGRWSIVLVLSPGGNLARFTATDGAGNTADATVEVFYDPPKEAVVFTANATWGSCDLSPPYDEYYGKGKPGTLVRIQSEFGSGSVEVSEAGEWYLKVVFETAPYGEPFLVKAKDAFGHTKVFEFVSYAG